MKPRNELTDLEKREAIARRLGWKHVYDIIGGKGFEWWIGPNGETTGINKNEEPIAEEVKGEPI